jgi:hypothetical protein
MSICVLHGYVSFISGHLDDYSDKIITMAMFCKVGRQVMMMKNNCIRVSFGQRSDVHQD